MATPTATGRSIYSDPSYASTAVLVVEPRPTLAAALIGIGAWFVLIEGLLFLFLGAFVFGNNYGVLGGALVSTGIFDSIIGVLLFGVALLVNAEPHHHVANGLLALVLVVMSYIFGFGGFFIGGIIALVGAFLAIFWTPPPFGVVTLGRTPPPPRS
jgi:hypothetical protein